MKRQMTKFEGYAHDQQYKKRDTKEAKLGEEEWTDDSIFIGFIITSLSLLGVIGIIWFIYNLVFRV